MSTSSKKRATFHSRLGFILVSAGCAVGLGNVWKFPYICGENGGGAFLLIYLLCLLLLGLPIVICEFAIGRGSRRSISQALNILEQPGSRWHITKYAGIAGNYLLMMFYTMVAGWMLYYAFLYGSGKITAVSAEETSGFFSRMLDSPALMILFAGIVIVLCIGICALGLQNGIEKITKVMMMLLIVLMLVLVVNSLRLKGAGEGLKYFLVPSFSRLKENGYGSVAFAAMTQLSEKRSAYHRRSDQRGNSGHLRCRYGWSDHHSGVLCLWRTAGCRSVPAVHHPAERVPTHGGRPHLGLLLLRVHVLCRSLHRHCRV